MKKNLFYGIYDSFALKNLKSRSNRLQAIQIECAIVTIRNQSRAKSDFESVVVKFRISPSSPYNVGLQDNRELHVVWLNTVGVGQCVVLEVT